MRHIFLTLFVLISALRAFPQYHTEVVNLEVNGLDRYCEVYIPENYSAVKKYPVVFVLHGGGGTAKGMVKFTGAGFNSLADREGFIVVYPNGFEKGWNDGERDSLAVARRLNIDDVGFFDAMIDDLDLKLSIDRDHVFACGISNGGFMVQRLAIERPDKFKAIAVVAASMSSDQALKLRTSKPVPVLFMCGTADPLVPYSGGPVTVLKQKRGEVLSVPETISLWKYLDGCTDKEETFNYPDSNTNDGCTASKTIWQNPEFPELKVVDIRIENGGHTWPRGKQYLPRKLVGNVNRDFDGCVEIWEFFNQTLSIQNQH